MDYVKLDRVAPATGNNVRNPRLDPPGASRDKSPMFMHFFSELRQARVPVTLKEYLMLMEALDNDDDVQNVFANFEISDEVMAKLSA